MRESVCVCLSLCVFVSVFYLYNCKYIYKGQKYRLIDTKAFASKCFDFRAELKKKQIENSV